MKIALAQINTRVGDFKGNFDKIKEYIKKALDKNCSLIIFPELTTTGYPPKDFLERKDFIDGNLEMLERIKPLSKDIAIIIGHVSYNNKGTGKPLYNSCSFIHKGKIECQYNKCLLPNYDVFDEERYFEASKEIKIIKYKKLKLGLSICEDIWADKNFPESIKYKFNPIKKYAEKNIDLLINISASPYTVNKGHFRHKALLELSVKYNMNILYTNLVGANDELVFDGFSSIYRSSGEILKVADGFKEDMIVYKYKKNKKKEKPKKE